MGAKQYVGINLAWGYDKRHLYCSMDEYAKTALGEFGHAIPKQHYHAPSKATMAPADLPWPKQTWIDLKTIFAHCIC